jgi:hypothetical protein
VRRWLFTHEIEPRGLSTALTAAEASGYVAHLVVFEGGKDETGRPIDGPHRRGEGEVNVRKLNWAFALPRRTAVAQRPGGGKTFPVEQRCLVPVDHYAITTKEGPNRGRWRATWPNDPDLCFAETWQPERPVWPASFAVITCAAARISPPMRTAIRCRAAHHVGRMAERPRD